MSTYVHKTGKGSIFANENRTEDNNQPHYTGSCKDPNGVDWEMLWGAEFELTDLQENDE